MDHLALLLVLSTGPVAARSPHTASPEKKAKAEPTCVVATAARALSWDPTSGVVEPKLVPHTFPGGASCAQTWAGFSVGIALIDAGSSGGAALSPLLSAAGVALVVRVMVLPSALVKLRA